MQFRRHTFICNGLAEGAVGDHRAKGRDVLAPMKVPVIIDANSKSTRRSFPWRSLPKEVNTRAFDCVVRREDDWLIEKGTLLVGDVPRDKRCRGPETGPGRVLRGRGRRGCGPANA